MSITLPVAPPRIEGREKVTGAARYAYEFPTEGVAYAVPVISSIAHGEIRAVDATAALAHPGVLEVITFENAPRLEPVDDPELAILQTSAVSYRGQLVAGVVAETLEAAREGERLLRFAYDVQEHDVVLTADHPTLYAPASVNGNKETDSVIGDAEGALATAAIVLDETYRTPAVHNNPMEPHASMAVWEGDRLTVHDSTQGVVTARDTIAQIFGLEAEQVRVISPHVGGGFGAKGTPRPTVILAVLAARMVGRPVKLTATRQQMFSLVGYRTPTIQRVRLGAEADGRLVAIAHETFQHSSTIREFCEQTAAATRVMYAAPNRLTTHRLARLNVPTPSWMRAPGECPGMFALESAMDELAIACGLDPVELRILNEPEQDPELDIPFSSRSLVACLREGAERFGWADRDPQPGVRRDGRWLVGTGVATSMYPTYRRPSMASARAHADGTFTVRLSAADIGTGARTVLTVIAAEALEVGTERVAVEIGDTALPQAPLAGGSMGTASWGTAIVRACEALLEELAEHGGDVPSEGFEASVDTTEEVGEQEPFSRNAFGAQFAEVRVDADTGETRVERLLGVFGVGRVIHPTLARSQLRGGMTMGLGMALLEESVLDREQGGYLNRDLAQYHVPACADVRSIEAYWVDEVDDHINPMGSKGIGEIGIVGTAAAIANAVHHATGVRVRDLPITLDKVLR